MLHQSILTHQFLHFFSTQTAEYSYRTAVRELLPQLCYLDNFKVEERHPSSVMGEDWIILQNAIKDNKSSGTAAEEGLCFNCGLGSLMHTCPGITGCSFFFCRRKHRCLLSWQQSIISWSFFQLFFCFQPSFSWFKTNLRLHSQVNCQTFTPCWTKTCFCTPTSERLCIGKQHPDTWLGTAETAFTFVCCSKGKLLVVFHD